MCQRKVPFMAPPAAHISTAYHAGICYLMLRRFMDAARVFTGCLNWVMRARQYHTQSYQYDQVSTQVNWNVAGINHDQMNKMADQMYALHALCQTCAPTRLDDNVINIVRERYGEQISHMVRG